MLLSARDDVVLPAMSTLHDQLQGLADKYAELPMLARTHGQMASPTTLGKEFANVIARLSRASRQFSNVEIRGKFNGAVGNFNAHVAAYPEIDWQKLSQKFVKKFGLTYNSYTTQIEPHDWIAEYSDILARFNTILIGLCRDIWSYTSIGYLKQKSKEKKLFC